MNVYTYQAALYCEDCIAEIKSTLSEPENIDDDYSFDSDDYPKGPFIDGGGESDCPSHCDNCNVFLENPLTPDGYDYVKESLENNGDSEVLQTWRDFYEVWA